MTKSHNNELHKFILNHGYSMRKLSVTIGFKSPTGLREVISKRVLPNGNTAKMSMDKWRKLGKELNMSVDEMFCLFDKEA